MTLQQASPLHADAERGLLLLARLAGDPDAGHRLTSATFGGSGFAWLVAKRIDALLDENPLQPLYDRIWARQRTALVEAMAALEGRGIAPLCIKGAEFHARYRGDRALGPMKDLDILVRRADVEGARERLRELGYRHGYFDPRVGAVVWLSPHQVACEEAGHYELAPLVRVERLDVTDDEASMLGQQPVRMPLWRRPGDRAWCLGTYVDVHHGVATNIAADRFLEASDPGTCGAGRSMAVSDLVWVTASRYYSEVGSAGKRSLRELAYVICALGDAIDWDRVTAAAVELELGPSLFYPLGFLRRAFGADVPDAVLDACVPTHRTRRRDWGWQLGSVFDFVEPWPLA